MKRLFVCASIIAIGLVAPLAAAANPPAKPKAERLKADVEKLVSFGTRHTLSSATDPKRGIGAARKWAHSEFVKIATACNGCLRTELLERNMSGPPTNNPSSLSMIAFFILKVQKNKGRQGYN
jgi:hypothetical protein